MERRSFLSLLAGAFAATTISPAAAAPSTAKLTAALDELERQQRFPGGPLDDFWPWTVTEELVINPGEPTDVALFQEDGRWPRSLAVQSLGWAWREDTRLADCKQVLGETKGDQLTPGLWLELMIGRRVYWSMPGYYVGGPGGILNRLAMPIVSPDGKFLLNVKAPALALAQPVTLQFYLSGVVGFEEWIRNGVPVPPA
ncbi:MAG: hypothetical protein IVW54_16805 [Candidatus Binataceae bacterium]|nr:hypothetical protein [Candidatus Binataceae bacterium]